MLVDGSVLAGAEGTAGARGSYDVVIVGAGAAGLTLAQALEGQGRKVLVLEAGALRETRAGRGDYAGEVAAGSSHPLPDLYRVRALGGTSRIWGGRCIPFDRIDFERRDWVDHSGWPLPYEGLAPYYGAALVAAEAGGDAFDPATVLPGEQAEMVPGLDGAAIQTTLERFSRPTDFWKRFNRALRVSRDVHVLPGTAVVDIGLRDNGREVEHLDVVSRSGRRHRIRAAAYVLASGGLETTRLLLASNRVKRQGIGNDGDQLGRYYMSHLCTTAAQVTFTPARGGTVAYDYARDAEGIYVRRRLWFTEAAQRRHRLLNVTFRTHLPEPGDPSHENAILSAMFLAKSFVQREYAAKFSESPVAARGYARHFANILRQPRALSRFARLWLRDRTLASRKLPSVVLPATRDRYILEFHAEQAPNPASRVTLGAMRDRYDLPRLHIDWRASAVDIDSVQRAHALLGQELEATGTGTLSFDPDILADRIAKFGIVGGHHIGTTRMSVDEASGVVDADCRVHGVANLYVASASVLPTSGQANPTLTVLALSLRLADHLRSALAGQAGVAVGDAAA